MRSFLKKVFREVLVEFLEELLKWISGGDDEPITASKVKNAINVMKTEK